MTFFVDANVILYGAGTSHYREPCLAVLRAIADGAAGRASTAVLEEVWHVELSGRAGAVAGLAERAYAALTPLLPVTDEIFARALSIDAAGCGANDRVHLATCLANDIGVIVSADRAFDGVSGVRRVDPLDTRALRRLLAASS